MASSSTARRGRASTARGARSSVSELSISTTQPTLAGARSCAARSPPSCPCWRTACFPVYRTYVVQRISAQDRRYIEWALAKARRRSRTADASVFDFIRHVLLLQPPEGASSALVDDYRSFTMRFQQFTAPVTAKGVEDTA